ncbi:hypothetical protein PS664_05065 [Pseudomonas fluorescens]|nr:hypothetical protein PS664_05065 [Pseudomonas fluorescens]
MRYALRSNSSDTLQSYEKLLPTSQSRFEIIQIYSD